jgi:hypothetical protein
VFSVDGGRGDGVKDGRFFICLLSECVESEGSGWAEGEEIDGAVEVSIVLTGGVFVFWWLPGYKDGR